MIPFLTSCETLIGDVVTGYHTRYDLQKVELEAEEEVRKYRAEKNRLLGHFPNPESFARTSQPYKNLLDRRDEHLERQKLKVFATIEMWAKILILIFFSFGSCSACEFRNSRKVRGVINNYG